MLPYVVCRIKAKSYDRFEYSFFSSPFRWCVFAFGNAPQLSPVRASVTAGRVLCVSRVASAPEHKRVSVFLALSAFYVVVVCCNNVLCVIICCKHRHRSVRGGGARG